jgi:hypothetical protein
MSPPARSHRVQARSSRSRWADLRPEATSLSGAHLTNRRTGRLRRATSYGPPECRHSRGPTWRTFGGHAGWAAGPRPPARLSPKHSSPRVHTSRERPKKAGAAFNVETPRGSTAGGSRASGRGGPGGWYTGGGGVCHPGLTTSYPGVAEAVANLGSLCQPGCHTATPLSRRRRQRLSARSPPLPATCPAGVA